PESRAAPVYRPPDVSCLTMTRRAVAVMVLLAAALPHAQPIDRARDLDARISRIFEAREYDVPRFGRARWLADGGSYTTVERGADQRTGSEIVRYDAKSGTRSILVSAAQLTPKGRSAPLEIDDYAWSHDSRRLLLFTNTRKVWRQNTRGD